MKTAKTLQLTLSFLLILLTSLVSAKNVEMPNAVSAEAVFSTFTSLDGKWTNINPKALPTILISGNTTKIRAWGKCSPTNCDWGTTRLYKHGAGYRATFNTSAAVRILTLNVLADGRLKVNAIYNYKDSRPTKRFTYHFKSAIRSIKKIDGNWVNLDQKSLPKLIIYANSTKIRAWGKCTPSNCPWGTVALTKFGAGYKAIFNDAVAKRTLIITPIANSRLRVNATYDYKDNRPTKRFVFTFKRATQASIDGIYANTNPKAMPKIHIYGKGTRIRAWGKCSPTNCDWGVTKMTKFGNKYKAVFNDHVAVRTLIITPIASGKLKMQATYNYKDSRPTKSFIYYFTPRRSS